MIDIKNLPERPGVYIYKDKAGKIIYVGKAINLKRRVGSYFSNRSILQPKTLELVSRISDISYIEVTSELEALLLESKLIKKHQPKYNFAAKDDKSPSFVVIFSDRIIVSRKGIFSGKPTSLLGPFISGDTAKEIFKILRRTFPFRDCSAIKFSRYAKLKRPCLYGLTNLCPAPCAKEGSVAVNLENIKKASFLLKGKKSKLVARLKLDMSHMSKNLDYENAARTRDQIKRLKSPTIRESVVDSYLYNPNLLADKADAGILGLKKVLSENGIASSLQRIEFYDISNIQGKDAVGSMVVAIDGILDKRHYRRFKIQKGENPNDYEMMKEVLERRLKHKEWGWPDLIVLDGGKGQLSTINNLLGKLSLDIPVVALAKKIETIVIPASPAGGLACPESEVSERFVEVNLLRENPAIRFLQQVRDEAHRFAVTYHRKLRLKELLNR